MPLLAHTKPWTVSVISTGPTMRTTRRAWRSTSSTTRASLSQRCAHSVAKSDGVTVSRSTMRPSALDTTLEVITTTSPSARAVAPATIAARSSPGAISGSPSTPTTSIGAGTLAAPVNMVPCPPTPSASCSTPARGVPVDGFDFTDITYHRAVEHGTVRVAFDRPEVRNAFRPHTVDELYRALDHARDVDRRRLRAAHRQRTVTEGRRVGVLLRRRPAHPRPRRLPVRRAARRPTRSSRAGPGGCTSSRSSG